MEKLKGADVLRAIAEGVNPDEFEWVHNFGVTQVTKDWPVEKVMNDLPGTGGYYRRKVKTRVINGYTVPAPVTEAPKLNSTYWVCDPSLQNWRLKSYWSNDNYDNVLFQRGLVFLDEKSAIANAKAMCGINPTKD